MTFGLVYGLYSRAASNQERLMMARVRYILFINVSLWSLCVITLARDHYGYMPPQLKNIKHSTWSNLDSLSDVSTYVLHTSPISHYFLGLNSVVEYPIGLEVKGRKKYLPI